VASVKLEAQHIGRELLAQHAAGVPWNEMGVFYTAPFVGEEIAAALQDMNLPFHWLKDAASRSFDPSHPSVKLMTPHSSKGLQYRVAIIGGVGFWPYHSEADEARLLYVAMTRATHQLVMTSSRSSKFSERLKALCAVAA
jgi:superfamily I DNA/RNA helicase